MYNVIKLFDASKELLGRTRTKNDGVVVSSQSLSSLFTNATIRTCDQNSLARESIQCSALSTSGPLTRRIAEKSKKKRKNQFRQLRWSLKARNVLFLYTTYTTYMPNLHANSLHSRTSKKERKTGNSLFFFKTIFSEIMKIGGWG
jgi:hypothetical protein